ncbi:protein COFACTOR ASSEMBLY OF COMPLEX C SUBUNIT B CCB4, chloroplastic isoform X3 [Cajanus cajan]|uniref:protein COFACTOR ASSEMBLY OF COMPLEX C SUBUNIT B CCB4, chloroplastic isoform X3 n=1 Tax=Cajanus cajan TaxID=3821 RepID=UPI00098D9686|nr:protein COFACTOR ASSEMBLY OF COMPLEX C SUBUNIT B CCB4, chloroplastic isoform X3 [Cajanus cajan]
MEAGTAQTLTLTLRLQTRLPIPNSNASFQPRFTHSSHSPSPFTAHSYTGPKPKRDFLADWVSQNDDAVRTLPIYVGAASLLAVLLNRALSGIAPVADAGSSQSRADLLTLGLAVTNILTGLVWLSIRPKSITAASLVHFFALLFFILNVFSIGLCFLVQVNPQGVECKRFCTTLPDVARNELLWVWKSLSDATCCRSLVIVYDGSCVLQIGFAAETSAGDGEAVSVDANKLMQGSVYQGVMKSGAQSYLANLSLYPGKSELPFLPSNTQKKKREFEEAGKCFILLC